MASIKFKYFEVDKRTIGRKRQLYAGGAPPRAGSIFTLYNYLLIDCSLASMHSPLLHSRFDLASMGRSY